MGPLKDLALSLRAYPHFCLDNRHTVCPLILSSSFSPPEPPKVSIWACSLFAQFGDAVVVEEPTYFVIDEVFRDRKLNVVGVPMDSQGLIVANLELI